MRRFSLPAFAVFTALIVPMGFAQTLPQGVKKLATVEGITLVTSDKLVAAYKGAVEKV